MCVIVRCLCSSAVKWRVIETPKLIVMNSIRPEKVIFKVCYYWPSITTARTSSANEIQQTGSFVRKRDRMEITKSIRISSRCWRFLVCDLISAKRSGINSQYTHTFFYCYIKNAMNVGPRCVHNTFVVGIISIPFGQLHTRLDVIACTCCCIVLDSTNQLFIRIQWIIW